MDGQYSNLFMIHIINRHCKYSNLSANKARPNYFSREKCFLNLVKTLGNNKEVEHHILFDGDMTGHFLSNYSCLSNLVQLNSGSGAKSFVDSVEFALSLNTNDEDIIYFLEDDYLHRDGWVNALTEGLSIGDSCWVSLYDAKDKYYSKLPDNLKPEYRQYENYISKITYTPSNHWRTACSTTDTFALKVKNLKKYKDIITKWSKITSYSLDHNRGLELNNIGLTLWTPMPGYSTHMEPAYMSPIIDWKLIQDLTTQ